GQAEPNVEVIAPRTGEVPVQAPANKPAQAPVAAAAPPPPAPAPAVNDAAIRDATKKLQTRVDELQGELEKTRTRFGSIEKEKETLNNRLQETNFKLEKAQGDLEKSKSAETKIRDQLAEAQSSLKKNQSGGAGGDAKAQEA